MLIEDYTLNEALYMSIITISTVGFGEVKPLSPEGRIFTILFIITNFGIFTYGVSNLTAFFVEGNARKLIKEYRMVRKIEQLQQHTIICGFGRNGKAICSELQRRNEPFVVIENNAAVEEELAERRWLYLIGDATDENLLRLANIQKAKALITTLPNDADNVFVVLTAKELNPKLRIISRASKESALSKLKIAGAHHVILPEHIGGVHMAQLVSQPDIVEFINLLTGDSVREGIFFEEFRYERLKQELQGKSIRQLNIRGRTGANVIGIKKANGTYIINPDPDVTIEPGDKLILLGNEEQILRFKQTLLE